MDTKSIATVAGAAAAGGVLALAGLSLATAATGSGDTSDGQSEVAAGEYGSGGPMGMRGPGMGGPHGTPVTGGKADQVSAAVQAKYPDATVLFVEEEDGGYEAHVRTADGTMLHVTLDADFAVTGEHQGPPMGGRMSGPGGMGHSGEKQLTGAKAKKVTAAAERRIPNGTVVRVETDSDGVYEAHVIMANGKMAIVEVGKSFQVTGVEKLRAHGPMGLPPAAGGTDTGDSTSGA